MKLTPQQFLDKFLSYAVQSETDNGINRWFTLSQSAIESGWDSKEAGAFNIFGIKSFNPNEPRELVMTFEFNVSKTLTPSQIGLDTISSVVASTSHPGMYCYSGPAWFKTFGSYAEAFDFHGRIFFENKVYSGALQFKSDYALFAKAIAPFYAQNPNYANDIISTAAYLKKLVNYILNIRVNKYIVTKN